MRINYIHFGQPLKNFWRLKSAIWEHDNDFSVCLMIYKVFCYSQLYENEEMRFTCEPVPSREVITFLFSVLKTGIKALNMFLTTSLIGVPFSSFSAHIICLK